LEGNEMQNKKYQDMQDKFDMIAAKMEEKEKIRKDPNRDFIKKNGLDFLEKLKFFNQKLDPANLLSATNSAPGKNDQT
jgi:hypothetical protein